jgi:glycosyltransferase involved in cell wall biosynthesis
MARRVLRVGIDLLSERGCPGGIHTYSNELVRRLAAGAEEEAASPLKIVVFAHADYRFLDGLEELPALEVVRTRWRGLGACARRLLEHALLAGLARRHDVDIVHSVNNVLPARLPVPGVVTVHDLSPFILPRRFGLLKRSYLRREVPASIRRAQRVISVSEATRADIIGFVPGAAPARLAVVPLATSAQFTNAPAPAAEEEVRRRYSLPAEFALHVSRIEPGKNLAAVLEALAILRGRGLEVPLVVAGAPTHHLRELERLWTELGIAAQVRCLGAVPAADLPHLYRLAKVFLFPSLHEGFGLPVLEAFASGTPTITARCSSLPEVAGEAALLVDPRRADELAAALGKVWRHAELRELLRARGLRRALDFSWERTAVETARVYREAAGGLQAAGAFTRAACLPG